MKIDLSNIKQFTNDQVFMPNNNQKYAFIIGIVVFIVILNSSVISQVVTNRSNNQNIISNSDNSNLNLANNGFVNESGQKVFWFLHVTDTQHIWYSAEKTAEFNQLLNESFQTIKPVLIYNTGDLVDSDYEHFVVANERNQRIEEWEAYNKSLHNNNMNSTVYLDVVGNHDTYGDPGNTFFLKYSMMGQSYNTLQYAFKKSFTFGEYAFIGLHTAEDYGAIYPFALFGYLNSEELDWYEEELEEFKDCNLIFTFGHQPPFEIFSEVNTNGESYFSLNDKYHVSSYFCGHGHINSFQNVNGMFAIETTKFDNDGGSYRIVAVDNNYISTSLEFVGRWPQGVITYPPREDYINEDLNNVQKIRALAWDPKGINSVQWSAYDSGGVNQLVDWTSMLNVTNNRTLWEANWASSLNDGKDYIIKVRINGGSGQNIKEISYSSKKSFVMNLYQWIPIIYTTFFSFVSLITVRTFYRRFYVPKYKKREEQKVDRRLRKLYLLKCLFFLVVPLTLGGIYLGQVTAIFSFFHVNSFGVIFNGLQLIYGGVIFLFSIYGQGLTLSYKHRNKFSVFTGLSVLILGFFIAFYILHFPTLSWFSPGLYTMIILDVYMFRRNIQMRKETRN